MASLRMVLTMRSNGRGLAGVRAEIKGLHTSGFGQYVELTAQSDPARWHIPYYRLLYRLSR
jgi:hypothetical protein